MKMKILLLALLQVPHAVRLHQYMSALTSSDTAGRVSATSSRISVVNRMESRVAHVYLKDIVGQTNCVRIFDGNVLRFERRWHERATCTAHSLRNRRVPHQEAGRRDFSVLT